MRSIFNCDNPDCDWSIEEDLFVGANNWHGIVCPKCGAGPIVSDDDLAIAELIHFGEQAGLIKDPSESSEVNGLLVTIDTAGLREGAKKCK